MTHLRRKVGTTKRIGPVAPGRFGAARCRSPWVRRDPGIPRALGLFPGAKETPKGDARRLKNANHRAGGALAWQGSEIGNQEPGTRNQDQRTVIGIAN